MKIIIENLTSLPMSYVLEKVKEAVERGRISDNGKMYCAATVIEKDGRFYALESKRNVKGNSDKFVMCEPVTLNQNRSNRIC